MDYKQQLCRTHGGYFSIPIKRGRPPVNCSEDNVCDAATNRRKTSTQATGKANGGRRPAKVANAQSVRNTVQKPRRQDQKPSVPTKAQQLAAAVTKRTGVPVKAVRGSSTVATPAVVSNNPSIRWASEAKRLLEPQGWKVQGRAWSEMEDDHKAFYASLIATRGEETISFLWRDAKLVSQDYKMWDTDKPSENGMPRKRLDFDPDEMSDAALIKRLSGRKVIWWNRLGKSTEHAVIPHGSDKRVKVEHLLNGNGDEEARVVTFVDGTNGYSATGFRSFHVSALLKVSG